MRSIHTTLITIMSILLMSISVSAGSTITNTVIVSPAGAGHIDEIFYGAGSYSGISSTLTIYTTQGLVVQYTAVPNTGYVFDRFVDTWNGNTFVTLMNPWVDTLDSSDTVLAVFAPEPDGEPVPVPIPQK